MRQTKKQKLEAEGFISVKDRLPDFIGAVETYHGGTYLNEAQFYEDEFHF